MAEQYYIGLMSGTSADATDAVLVLFGDTGAEPRLRLVATHRTPMPQGIRRQIEAAITGPAPLAEVAALDVTLGHLFGEAANAVRTAAGLEAHEIQAIGSHGQTIRHAPRHHPPYTIQIGDPAVIAERTGITVVGHFRTRDVAAGGEGAPLVPAFHQWLFASPTETRVVLNLGGIGNVTVLAQNGAVQGFDTGPANTLLDRWIEEHQGRSYDADGAWAATGKLIPELLARLRADPYFTVPPPKSTGREYFHRAWLAQHLGGQTLADVDVQATLTELTAWSIAQALERFSVQPARKGYVCGGGRHNTYLMGRLAQAAPGICWQGTEVLGLDPDWVEATAFAWLAARTLDRAPGNLVEVTGAHHPVVLGAIYWGAPRTRC